MNVHVIQRGAEAVKRRGMSDEQVAFEMEARQTLDDAIVAMRVAIKTVNFLSTVVQIDPTTFENFAHDELSFEWAERISEARNV